MKTTITSLLFCLLLITGCSPEKKTLKNVGLWRIVIASSEGQLPFRMLLNTSKDGYTATILNGYEKLETDPPIIKGDSIFIPIEMFDAELAFSLSDSIMDGVFRKRNNSLELIQAPAKAIFGQNMRFVPHIKTTKHNVNGRYTITFNDAGSTYPAVGEFKQEGNWVTGSFLTETGDYRFLDGNIDGDSLYLSTFNGNNAYLFKAKINGEKLENGIFSYLSGTENFEGYKDANAALTDANTLTYLKEGFTDFNFSVKNKEGKTITLDDPVYKNKVVLVQLLGSWCPNCMDETRLIAPFYDANKDKGLEIIGLAFERSSDSEVVNKKIDKMKAKFGMNYQVYHAGNTDKDQAQKLFPMLNHVMSFPTLIILDREHKVHRIHTGFSGPSTGVHYTKFVEEFNKEMEYLLAANEQ